MWTIVKSIRYRSYNKLWKQRRGEIGHGNGKRGRQTRWYDEWMFHAIIPMQITSSLCIYNYKRRQPMDLFLSLRRTKFQNLHHHHYHYSPFLSSIPTLKATNALTHPSTAFNGRWVLSQVEPSLLSIQPQSNYTWKIINCLVNKFLILYVFN